MKILHCASSKEGQGGSVGIATCYGLDDNGDRIPVGARFSACIQTGFGAHPASCAVGTGSLYPGLSGQGVALTTHLHLAQRLKKEKSYAFIPPLSLHSLF